MMEGSIVQEYASETIEVGDEENGCIAATVVLRIRTGVFQTFLMMKR